MALMDRYQITHINNDRRDNKHGNIKHFSGLCPDGVSKWSLPIKELIAWMKGHPDAVFYTNNLNELAIVEIIPATIFSNEYLRTRSHNELSDNLLSLPEYPGAQTIGIIC